MKLNKDEAILAIDGDVPCYSIGFGAEDIEQSWIVDKRIDEFIEKLQERTGVQQYEIYLTGKGNFREQLAVSHEYKGGRKAEKPKWYKYIRDYFVHVLGAEVVQGMEADDKLAMRLTEDENVVCCTIDKDLLQVEGWHYSWKTHNKDEAPLHYVDWWGKLEREKKKLYGEGVMWLYAQALLGDKTDNIIGIERCGDAKAYKILKDCKTEEELYLSVKEAYEVQFGDKAEDRLRENMNLLYMVREYNEDGSLRLWRPPI